MPLIDVQGTRIDVTQQGTGRDLVLLHSLLSDRTAFERVAPALARSRRVWLVNLPGYGASTPAVLATIEAYADCVARLLDALHLPRDADVLGNGFGGFISASLAARHSDRFGRLIVADALIAFPEPAKQPLRALAGKVEREGMTGALDIAITRMFPPAFAEQHPDIIDERKQALAAADAASFSRACRALAIVDLGSALARVANRTLVLVGSLDATTPPAGARALADAIPAARFEEIADCGHCPQIERPDAFVTAVQTFLDE